MPLERNTVRFIDNFSAGTRASASAEYFISRGYAVVFLHRQFSLLPYSRFYSHSKNCLLDYLEPRPDGSIAVNPAYCDSMRPHLDQYLETKRRNAILFVPFVTVNGYVYYLRTIALEIRSLESRIMFYLAAAVADFYVPSGQMSEHKIQSDGGVRTLQLELEPVPKFLKPLVQSWAPYARIVSFKLETDPLILEKKARQSLRTYGHDLVIANLLATRKNKVLFVTEASTEEIALSPIQADSGIEIEQIMVDKLVKMHDMAIRDSVPPSPKY